MNESGNTTFFGLCLLLLFSYYGLTKLSNKIKRGQDLMHKQRVLLCSKEINGMTSRFISQIVFSNKTLKYLTIGEFASLLIPFPGINLATKNGAKAAIKIAKRSQTLLRIIYKAQLSKTYLNGCKFKKSFLQTPFTKKRDKLNQLIIRNKIWVLKVLSGAYLISSKHKVNTQEVTSSMKKVNFLQNFLFF
jgi:hypothetical protein